ncbi:hypothetical protein ABENE_15595 [Asticcacaulis benevestitus DSM 16100 = ATCC BAA-896]|uniref:Uncharacterized protein n=1 Tax=Asticcacaulis benevestitus DSM 16100 = ATCC BAA-896 TaxID=1121022 RepID=V4PN15_9CAUL|nr:hypothetical protein ABENE_15595 [Asticcacaulis benevestitus DSM 16100 = ATCC BAA-896]
MFGSAKVSVHWTYLETCRHSSRMMKALWNSVRGGVTYLQFDEKACLGVCQNGSISRLWLWS